MCEGQLLENNFKLVSNPKNKEFNVQIWQINLKNVIQLIYSSIFLSKKEVGLRLKGIKKQSQSVIE